MTVEILDSLQMAEWVVSYSWATNLYNYCATLNINKNSGRNYQYQNVTKVRYKKASTQYIWYVVFTQRLRCDLFHICLLFKFKIIKHEHINISLSFLMWRQYLLAKLIVTRLLLFVWHLLWGYPWINHLYTRDCLFSAIS